MKWALGGCFWNSILVLIVQSGPPTSREATTVKRQLLGTNPARPKRKRKNAHLANHLANVKKSSVKRTRTRKNKRKGGIIQELDLVYMAKWFAKPNKGTIPHLLA